MSYRWIDHTGELELRIEAASEGAVFEDAMRALRELAEPPAGAAAVEEVEVTASDRATLLAGWMEELVFLSETADFVPDRVTRLKLAPAHLSASVEGRRGEPRHLVKGVTYHRLAFGPAGRGFRATVVLDV